MKLENSTIESSPANNPKSQLLTQIKTQLKKEFVGLDAIIDQFIYAVKPWCLMAEQQTSPLVINLWGMTGVGKSSLVRRFIELWGQGIPLIEFNLSSSSFSSELLNHLEYSSANSGEPCFFIFDEFQHAKSLKNGTTEIDNPFNRMIWQVIDEGKFSYITSFYDKPLVYELSQALRLCLERGMKIEKGKVVEGKDLYCELFDPPHHVVKNTPFSFISSSDVDNLHVIYRERFPYKFFFRDYISQLDGPDLLAFLEEGVRLEAAPKKVDFRKALIFVIGNLDEAFESSGSMSSDTDPDSLHQSSKKISFNLIKETLRLRFRVEEIARLGNIHLIYPALSGQVYRNFIQAELSKLQEKFMLACGIHFHFEQSVHDTVYTEGVVAAQGFRPVKSTLKFLLESAILALIEGLEGKTFSEITLAIEDESLTAYAAGEQVGSQKLHLPIYNAQKAKHDPQREAITAVHESGHALVYMLLKGKLPLKVSLRSSDFSVGGFVRGENESSYLSWQMLMDDVAIRMAGRVAETLVFGEKHLSTGSSGDLQKATEMLMDEARHSGFAGEVGAFEHPTVTHGFVLDITATMQDWVKEQIQTASHTAQQMVQQYQYIYQLLVKELIAKELLEQADLEELFQREEIDLKVLLNKKPFDYTQALDKFLETYDFEPAHNLALSNEIEADLK